PAEEQVVTQLFTNLPFAAHRIEDLQQQRADQLLGRDRISAAIGVDLVEARIHTRQRLIDQQSNHAQRMVRRNEVVELGYGEQALLHRIRTTHRHPPKAANMTTTMITTLLESAL